MGCCVNKEPLSEMIRAKLVPTAIVECVPNNKIVIPLNFRPARNPRSPGAALYDWDVAAIDDSTAMDALRQNGYEYADVEYTRMTIWRKLKSQYSLKLQLNDTD